MRDPSPSAEPKSSRPVDRGPAGDRLPPPSPTTIDPAATCFFLDFDGTLVEIAERPDAVNVPALLPPLLDALSMATGGAVAIISGRGVDVLDGFLGAVPIVLAGGHGAEIRMPGGRLLRRPADKGLVERLEMRLRAFADGTPGLLVEPKTGSVALHYRHAPALQAQCLAFGESLAQETGAHLLPGKMVVELLAGRWSKADAVVDLLRSPPFAGRMPVYMGDDVTDERVFAALRARPAITVKVGSGETQARHRAASVADVHVWLAEIARAGMPRADTCRRDKGSA